MTARMVRGWGVLGFVELEGWLEMADLFEREAESGVESGVVLVD